MKTDHTNKKKLPLLFATFPKAARLKKSILVVAVLLGVIVLFVILHYLSTHPPQKIEDSLDNEQENTHWLSAAANNHKTNDKDAQHNMQEKFSAPPKNEQAASSTDLTVASSQDARLKEALEQLETQHHLNQHNLSEEVSSEESIQAAQDSPIQTNLHPNLSSPSHNDVKQVPAIDLQSARIIPAGTLIPIIILTDVNSELPGYVAAQVTRDVYAKGQQRIILQGAKVLLHYDTVLGDQARLALSGISLCLPNGNTLSLEDMPVVDTAGQVGLQDKTNHHYARNFLGLLVNAFSTTAPQVAASTLSHDNISTALMPSMIPANYAHPVQSKATTFNIRMGYQCNILLVHDIKVPL